MKKFIIIICFGFTTIFAQNAAVSPFSQFHFGVFGGVNFTSSSDFGGSFYLEGKTNITSSISLKAALGYSRISVDDNYIYRSYSAASIEGADVYTTRTNEVEQVEHEILPSVSVGLQYIFNDYENFTPYLIVEGGYNIITTELDETSTNGKSFGSLEEVPDEFKSGSGKTYADNSYRAGVGFGGLIGLTENLNIDVRYLLNYDSEVSNSHQLLVGLVF